MFRIAARWALALLLAGMQPCVAAVNAGDPAPNVVLGVTASGDSPRAADYAGKVVVISFWASWCAPCRKELAILEGLQVEGKGNIQVIAVNIESRDLFIKAAKVLGELHLMLTNDRNDRAQRTYDVKAIPQMVIIGKDGRVLSVHKGYGDDGLKAIVDEINHALAAAPSA